MGVGFGDKICWRLEAGAEGGNFNRPTCATIRWVVNGFPGCSGGRGGQGVLIEICVL